MAQKTKTLEDRLLEAVSDREVVAWTNLRDHFGVTPRTVQRHLNTLLESGELVRRGRGLYSRRTDEPSLNVDAQALLGLLRESDADAHLTGFDILAPYAHQFVFDYEHLVYCHPPHLSALAAELASTGWRVVPAGRRRLLAQGDARVVVVRGQTHDERRFPVRNHRASPEKAWIDLLREVRRSELSLDFVELGRILRAVESGGAQMPTLRAYARRVGYLDWLQATLGESEPENAEQRQLAAGYAA